MCSKGFSDLLITSPIVGEVKVRRLVELWRRYRDVKVVVDDAGAASRVDDEISRTKGEEKMKVLLDLDVGLHRTGVQPGPALLSLAKNISSLSHLQIIGIQGYEGHLQHVPTYSLRKQQTLEAMTTLTSSADSLRQAGHDISIVSTAGTGTYPFCISVPGITEIQPGSFIFMDTDYRNCLEDSPQQKIPKFSNSVSILSTVISVQGPNYVTIDAGLKSLTTDSGLAECKESRFIYGVMGDEHGSLTWDANASEQDSADGIGKEVKDWKKSVKGLKIGDRIEMLPSHIDPTINLHNVYYAHRDGIIEEIWEVEGRGCVQ